MRRDVHLVAIQGEPDRLLETSGRDATALCGKAIKQAKCVGRMDEFATTIPATTVMICNPCLRAAVSVLLGKRGVMYLYGILPSTLADRLNADKGEE